MGMLRVCSADGCETKTLGPYCIEHEDTAGATDLLDAVVFLDGLELVPRAFGARFEPAILLIAPLIAANSG